MTKKTWTSELREPYRQPSRYNNYAPRRNPNDSMGSTVLFNCEDPLLEKVQVLPDNGVYKPTITKSEASLASTKRSASKISEVYSNSENTMEFAHNFSVYLTSIVSPFIWIALFILLSLWGFVLLLVGSFNLPYCTLQPMIPIYLVVTGSLFIVAAIIRIYSLWPVPENTRQSSSLGITLLCRLIEALVLLAILVWLILGAVYVYSARRTYHRLGPDMFEKHYCDPGTYWIAFVSVSLHIALIALIILVAIVILACGLWKETGQQIRQNNNY